MSLEEKVIELENKLIELEKKSNDEYVTPKQLADIMQCSTNYIYIKIREGEIITASNLGSCIRIPMSQFRSDAKIKSKVVKIQDYRKMEDEKPSSIQDIKQFVWK